MRGLSQRQKRILQFIRDHQSEHGYPPTIREIGLAASISSTSVVDYNLRVLQREGLIRRDREVSRGLGLAGVEPEPTSLARVPVVGCIAAGEPIEAFEGEHESLEFSAQLVPEGCFALRVKGKSMIEDLIDDGDIVVIRPQQTAQNGDIVVALLNNQGAQDSVATLKRFYRERNQVRLQPANATMDPIFVDPSNLQVQGKVVAVMRTLF
ncbi:MAG: transcriptional repressor LexA [Chloroflexota bacterium]